MKYIIYTLFVINNNQIKFVFKLSINMNSLIIYQIETRMNIVAKDCCSERGISYCADGG